jgi:solute carrier family 25 carnitine/acylcarnitine transporter 20/29
MASESPKTHTPVFWKDFIAGYISGIVNVMAGQPFDNCKIKMVQTGRSLLWTATNTVKVEGPFAFWKGSTFPLVGFGFCNSIIFAINENVKHFYRKQSKTGELGVQHFFMAGGLAGLANTIISCPMEHLRIRMANDVGNKLYNGPIDCLRKIYGQFGMRGLMRGFWVTAVREFLLYGAYFGGYEGLKQWGKRSDTFWMMFIGGIGGMCGWMGGFAFDNIKTRLQTDDLANPRYRSWEDIRRVLTPHELTKGFSAGFVRSFPVNALTFFSFELAMRAFYGHRH